MSQCQKAAVVKQAVIRDCLKEVRIAGLDEQTTVKLIGSGPIHDKQILVAVVVVIDPNVVRSEAASIPLKR